MSISMSSEKNKVKSRPMALKDSGVNNIPNLQVNQVINEISPNKRNAH